MEALQLLVEMVKELPDMAVWVILAFFFYKAIIVGSIYGVIKHVATKIHDAVVAKKREVKEVDVNAILNGMTITDELDGLIFQISRIKGARSTTGKFIHRCDIEWLTEAIDEKLAAETQKRELPL